MLKITKIAEDGKANRLRLDGTLSGPWVEELQRQCEARLEEEETLVLDCAGLSFVDARGIRLMRSLSAQQVLLVDCSPYLALQLKETADRH
jgi:anti-anti-sigma regulatory factor